VSRDSDEIMFELSQKASRQQGSDNLSVGFTVLKVRMLLAAGNCYSKLIFAEDFL